MPYVASNDAGSVAITDALASQTCDNGLYRLTFERGAFGLGDPVLSRQDIGKMFTSGSTMYRVNDVAVVNSDTVTADVEIVTDPIPLVVFVTWIIGTGIILGLIGWNLKQFTKLADTATSVDGSGKRTGLFDQIKNLALVLIFGGLAFAYVRFRRAAS